ncbi:cellulose synthase [Chimaeribacter arupi]|uniref:Glycosyltransferase n=1 Tax=Nissabacter archeti TaxID=1917880 RepID=A0ABS5JF54_9GAMM|nr:MULTISPECIES: glycosyltransferase [Yersiniaceae]MBS0968578.1 glycosyltransferase [Nissabacter archeti]MDV5139800.1 glycosyltransferase [Chimaeribacter arupi]PLR33503.1 cellulose synthase [Chimaeribacter arupi]PLR46611.1 cellulose synthase [Chimaeribacter arupi]PLR52799.1 cellulose synthase [Chimaeribacter arupi]
MAFYFSHFEHRKPPEPLNTPWFIQVLWQCLAVAALILGANYIRWRWMSSLNYDALWYAVPLVVAETLAYIGTVFFTINLWKEWDIPQRPAPTDVNECLGPDEQTESRPLRVDLFIATYSEDVELVRISIQDALKVTYPAPIEYKIHVLDDGRRPEMRAVAEQEGVNYITRDTNIGYKAGNLRNGMEQTDGDFLVICDADTRVFPTLLTHTLGYFRDPDVAWVQTPQWFYDLPEGNRLPELMRRKLGRIGYGLGKATEALVGPIVLGRDPFFNDARMFYEVILRRRNWANASFCCGAASIHRREAVMQAALRSYVWAVDEEVARFTKDIPDADTREALEEAMRPQVIMDTELTPYKFHVSEDIYTSIVLHGDTERRWKSVMHPRIESKMLSPQDLLTWMIQRFKYAAGSMDILLHDPIFSRKRFRLSLPQTLMYGTTFWSYLACLWNTVFLISPLIYLFTNIPPVSAYSQPFYLHFLPFFLASELAFMFGTWGLSAWDGRSSYLSLYSMNLRALDTVLRGEKIKFHVTPKERQQGRFLYLVKPQIAIVVLTLLGLLWGGIKVFNGDIEDPSGYIINIFWGGVNIAAMMPMILAAMWKPDPALSDEEVA